LAAMPAGPQLGVVLAGVDPTRVHGGHLTQLARAYPRAIANLQAGLLEVVWGVFRTPGGDGGPGVRRDEPDKFAARLLAPLVAWTTYKAEQMVTMARLAVHIAPALLVAMKAGRLDLDRLQVIARELAAIEDEPTIRQVVARFLDQVDTY